MPDTAAPVFITGSYRTGSTLLSRMIDAHPDMWIMYDTMQFMRFTYGRFDPLEERVGEALEDIRLRIGERAGVALDARKAQAAFDASGGGYAALYHAVMTALAPDGIRWGEKTNVCWGRIPDFLDLFPNGRAIHILRDPRDVTASFRHFTIEEGLRYLDAAYNTLGSMQAALDYSRTLPADRYRAVRFEDILMDGKAVLKDLCAFLGLDFHPRMLDLTAFRDNAGRPWKSNTAKDPNFATISTKPVGVWKERLPVEETAFVELVLGPVMPAWGYEPSGLWPTGEAWARLGEFFDYAPLADRHRQWLLCRAGFEGFPSDSVRTIQESGIASATAGGLSGEGSA